MTLELVWASVATGPHRAIKRGIDAHRVGDVGVCRGEQDVLSAARDRRNTTMHMRGRIHTCTLHQYEPGTAPHTRVRVSVSWLGGGGHDANEC